MSTQVSPNSDRVFFATMTCIAFAVTLAGFARTFYLKPLFDTPALEPLVHVHGVAFTLWPLLVIVQVLLIRAGNYHLHRALGMFGVAVAAVMVITGYMVVIGKPRPTEALRAFIFTPMVHLLLFPLFVAAGIRLRREAAKHKRLMYLATFLTVIAGMRRLLVLLGFATNPNLTFVISCALLLVPLFVYDAFTLRRIHPVTMGGTVLVLAVVPIHQAVAFTGWWQHFAHWLTNT